MFFLKTDRSQEQHAYNLEKSWVIWNLIQVNAVPIQKEIFWNSNDLDKFLHCNIAILVVRMKIKTYVKNINKTAYVNH